MAGLMARTSTISQAKFSKLLDRAEDPGETLDLSYEQQLQQLQNVKRGRARRRDRARGRSWRSGCASCGPRGARRRRPLGRREARRGPPRRLGGNCPADRPHPRRSPRAPTWPRADPRPSVATTTVSPPSAREGRGAFSRPRRSRSSRPRARSFRGFSAVSTLSNAPAPHAMLIRVANSPRRGGYGAWVGR
jgi:hypothetical protein